MTKDDVRRRLEFYQDLGIKTLYRRTATNHQPPATSHQPLATTPVLPIPALEPDHDSLLKILADIGDCKRCRLHEGRNKIVFGSGNEAIQAGIRR